MRAAFILYGIMGSAATAYAGMLEIGARTFSSGPGMVLIILTFLGLGSFLLSSLLTGIGQGQIAAMVRVGGILGCLITIAVQVYDTLAAIARAMGIGL